MYIRADLQLAYHVYRDVINFDTINTGGTMNRNYMLEYTEEIL